MIDENEFLWSLMRWTIIGFLAALAGGIVLDLIAPDPQTILEGKNDKQ